LKLCALPVSKPLISVNFEALKIMAIHQFEGCLVWLGNLGTGASAYNEYGRNFEVNPIAGSANPAFRGDGQRSFINYSA
jgi:hypothetical protein